MKKQLLIGALITMVVLVLVAIGGHTVTPTGDRNSNSPAGNVIQPCTTCNL